jgi:hypothetical protein
MPAGVSAYVPLANITLGANASTVTFSSINQTYRDLIFVLVGTTTGTAFSRMRMNGDAGNNYSLISMEGNGSNVQSTQSGTGSNIALPIGSTMESATSWLDTIQILDYSQTNKVKTGVMRSVNASDRTSTACIRWNSTSAITSVEFTGNNQPFAAGLTVALYGVTS